jgi:hypothetical protein
MFLGLSIVLAAAALLSGCDLFSKPRRSEKINERWETNNRIFKVRVTAYSEENGGFVGGAYYVFESADLGSDKWREIMTFRHDDPLPIPRDQVRFVSDKTANIFMGWMYAVTTDGGSNWSVWSAERDLPNWQCCNYKLIQDVRIEQDGVGIMRLSPIPERRGEVPELHTKDFGQHWSSK